MAQYKIYRRVLTYTAVNANNKEFPTYIHNFLFYYERFGLTRDHLQEMLSVDYSLQSSYYTLCHCISYVHLSYQYEYHKIKYNKLKQTKISPLSVSTDIRTRTTSTTERQCYEKKNTQAVTQNTK